MNAMPKKVKKDILCVLGRAQRYINKAQANRLKSLSEYTINNVMIFQDADSLSIAIATYAIYKLLDHWGYSTEYADQIRNMLGSAQFVLEENNQDEYREKIRLLLEFISNIEKEFRIYVQKVIEKAQVKKGSSLYDRGLSSGKVSELLGIGQWELLSYIGKTKIHDEQENKTVVEKRMIFARTLFENEINSI